MAAKQSILDSLFRKARIYKIPRLVGRAWEPIDLFLNREDQGYGRRITPGGQAVLSLLIPLGVVLFMVAGPTLAGRGWSIVFLVLIGFAAMLLTAKANTAFRMQMWQALVFLVLAIAIAFLQPEDPRTLNGDLTFHVFIPLIVFVAIWAVLSRWLAKYCLLRGQSRQEARSLLAPLVSKANLFKQDFGVEEHPSAVVRAYATALFSSYFLVLWIPAVAVLLAGTGLDPFGFTEQVRFNAAVFGVVGWAVLAAAHFDPRLESLLETMKRGLFTGTPALLSVLVIVLALGRLLEISYVATVFSGSSAGVIISVLLCLYFISWYDEYWTGRSITRLLFALLQSEDEVCDDRAMENGLAHIHVPLQGVLHRFGSRRVLAVPDDPKQPKRVLHIVDLLRELRIPARHSHGEVKTTRLLRELRERYLIYVAVGVLVTLAALLVVVSLMLKSPPRPGLVVRAKAYGTVNVADRLRTLSAAEGPKGRPILMIAASGGGSRAALYAAAGLRAIASRGYAPRILSLSSVSGGSAAVAGFISHDLIHQDPTPAYQDGKRIDPWSQYATGLQAEYFSEVIGGMFEWRMTQGQTMGDLLAESFERRMGVHGNLGDLPSGPAVCFNASIAGFRGGGGPIERTSDLWQENLHGLKLGTSMDAGGRLVITNVQSPFLSASRPIGFPHVVVRGANIPLSVAASMSANFPPVFSDVTIQIQRDSEAPDPKLDDYWSVTDGGAVENRGLLTTLKLLQDTLNFMGTESGPTNPGSRAMPLLDFPPIRILVLDAGLLNSDYEGGRGLTAIAGSASRIATAYAANWCQELDRRYRSLGGGGVKLLNLPMPGVIRSSGAFGTHWQPPSEVMLKAPSWVVDPKVDSVVIPKERLPEIIEAVFLPLPDYAKVSLNDEQTMGLITTWLWPDKQDTLDSRLTHALGGPQ